MCIRRYCGHHVAESAPTDPSIAAEDTTPVSPALPLKWSGCPSIRVSTTCVASVACSCVSKVSRSFHRLQKLVDGCLHLSGLLFGRHCRAGDSRNFLPSPTDTQVFVTEQDVRHTQPEHVDGACTWIEKSRVNTTTRQDDDVTHVPSVYHMIKVRSVRHGEHICLVQMEQEMV